MALSHTAHQQVATGRCRSAWRELRQLRRLQRAAPQQSTIQCSSTAVCSPVTEPTRSPSPTQTLQPQAPALRSPQALEDALPIFVALEHDLFTAKGTLGYEEALRVGLKALRLLGVKGVSCDVLWGLVETQPQTYNWGPYRTLFKLISDMGFQIKVNLCFSSTDHVPLPEWILKLGAEQPDIFFTDKAGQRCTECLTVGIDDVSALAGRTAIETYADVMRSFRHEFRDMLGTSITDVLIGTGPQGELKYPSFPHDRWEYPGVGEFQCYDRYMLASLKACAEQVQQPPWGLGGPHDAGSYSSLPHQSGFFNHAGSWSTPYGSFFLQWYSEMLTRHAHRMVGAAAAAFAGTGVSLHARIPSCYWWHDTASHGPQLTAGYFHTSQREGYLPSFKALATHGAGVQLGLSELGALDKTHGCDPERLMLHQRTVAAALHLPVTVENVDMRFDDVALARIEKTLFEPHTNLGIEVPPVKCLVFNRMSDHMFEATNWQRFKTFVRKVRTRAEGESQNVCLASEDTD